MHGYNSTISCVKQTKKTNIHCRRPLALPLTHALSRRTKLYPRYFIILIIYDNCKTRVQNTLKAYLKVCQICIQMTVQQKSDCNKMQKKSVTQYHVYPVQQFRSHGWSISSIHIRCNKKKINLKNIR